VQGYADPFRDLIEEARRLDLAVLQLGDVIDRGPDSPGAMALMLELAARDEGVQIAGNHCDKFYRFRQGRRVEIAKSGLAMTIEQLDRRRDGAALAQRYTDHVARLPLWRAAGPYFFVHGAFHPGMRRQRPPTVADRHREKQLASLALFGETSGETTADGKPVRTYRWVDRVPSGVTVCIGHDVVSTSEIVVRDSAAGGRVVHLDLGPDRGGRIGHLDIDRAALLDVAGSDAMTT
jgi:protein phosphatase